MSIQKYETTYRILGKVNNKSGKKISNFKVFAYDKDLLNDDFLGSSNTSKSGVFEILFDLNDFSPVIFDRRPDVYFKVFDGDQLILDTQSNIICNATPSNLEGITLDIDVADEAVHQLPVQETILLGGAAGTNYKMTTSTEMMENYKQVELIAPQKDFLAAQTAKGHALFFSIGTDNKFYLTHEKEGSLTGWEKTEISAKLPFPGKAKMFDVAQNYTNGNIDVALVITNSAGVDSLYLSFGNSNADLNWIKNIQWAPITDDRKNATAGLTLSIQDISLAKSKSGESIIVADTKDGNNLIARYWIDRTAAQKWNHHPMPNDLSTDTMLDSQIGRKAGAPVDGIYTLGNLNNLVELIYVPVKNPFDPTVAPNPTNLDISNTTLNVGNCAFSVCKAAAGNADETDVFLAGGGNLYYYSSSNQQHMATPIVVCKSDLFNNVRKLFTSNVNNRIVVWGLNANDEIFYCASSSATIGKANSCSMPLPLRKGVEQLTTYVDNTNSGLTYFANIGGGEILKGFQDATTSLWKTQQIELPTLDDRAKPTKAMSYTSTLHVSDENNIPVANTEVTVTAKARVKVHINNLYYSLDTTPIKVKTDSSGVISIIEWVDGMKGTSFDFHMDDPSQKATFRPVHASMEKVSKLNSVDSLNKATITLGDGTQKSLIPSSVSDTDKANLAKAIKSMNTAFTGIKTGGNNAIALGGPSVNGTQYITAVAGDLFSWIAHEVKHVVEIVKDTATDAWHFIVTIAGKVYGFLLKTVEEIGQALVVIWKQFVKGLEDLWNFIKFIFAWGDIVRTKQAMMQLIRIFFGSMADELKSAKKAVNTKIDGAEQTIRDWAKLPTPDLGTANHPLDKTLDKKESHPKSHSAPARMLMNHFKHNVHRSEVTLASSTTSEDTSYSGLDDLSSFFEREKATMNLLIGHVKELFVSNGKKNHPDLKVILKKIVGDIAIMALDTFKLVIDEVLDFMIMLIDDMLAGLDAPIYIPIVSDILEDLFGIKLPSVLEVICLIGAVPATIIYKAMHQKAPFPSGDNTISTKINNAKTYADLKTAFGSSNNGAIQLKGDDMHAIYETGHLIAGVANILKGILQAINEESDGLAKSVIGKALGFSKVVAMGSSVVSNFFDTPAPLQNPTMKTFSSTLSKLGMLNFVAFLVAPKAVKKKKKMTDEDEIKKMNKKLGVVSDGIGALLALLGLVPAAYHIGEAALDSKISVVDKSLGIMGATENITSKLANITGFAAEVDTEEISKQVLIFVQFVLIEITAGLQLEEAVVNSTRTV